MRLLKYSHACVRVESDAAVLVIDPGAFTEPEALDGRDAVLITHEHFDHLDVDKLADALGKRPAGAVFTHPEVVGKLGALDGAITTVNSGDAFEAAGLRITAHGGLHAEIHPDVRGWSTWASWWRARSTTRATRSTCPRAWTASTRSSCPSPGRG
jgi:L-ascorbate metabolism protein UlaG (beta-lactamase superfamily)